MSKAAAAQKALEGAVDDVGVALQPCMSVLGVLRVAWKFKITRMEDQK